MTNPKEREIHPRIEVLSYDPDTGILTWLEGPHKGMEAGWIDQYGYKLTRLDQKTLLRNHHIIWYKMTGVWPKKSVDHINNDPSDNRWVNLRLANEQQQGMNQKLQKRRKGKWKGVHQLPNGKYSVKIKHNQKNVAGLGCRFTDPREAALAYNYAAERLFGSYATFNLVFDQETNFKKEKE